MADIYNNIRGIWEKISSDSVIKMIKSEPTAEITRTGIDSIEIYVPTAHPDVRLTRVKNLSRETINELFYTVHKTTEMDEYFLGKDPRKTSYYKKNRGK